MTTKQDILEACTVDGMNVKLPDVQLERNLYKDVAKALELIGGKWKGGKIMAFVFPHNPAELLSQIASGEKRNLKKEFQFFATPAKLADKLIGLADIQAGDYILEPSSGQGAIIDAINRNCTANRIMAIELMPTNCSIMKMSGKSAIEGDFLKLSKNLYGQFDKVIANPPFSKNQDIDHIIQMYLCCKKGGKIVTISGKHWQYASEKKCQQFRDWLSEVNAEIIEIESGGFKESGTGVATCIIIIDK